MARKIGATIQDLERKQGAAPTDEQVAAALDVPIEDYRANLEQLVHVTVGALEMSDDTIMPTGDESSPQVQAMQREAFGKVRSALERIDKRDVLILSLYYNEELTYSEIGEVLEVTASRVCQLHGRAIARLRAELEGAA
jgi:RNA polymerase sigma factor for flagellar operon FliA